MKNFQDLGASPFPYIVPFLPRPLPNEVFKGKHFVLTNLLKFLLKGRSRAPCPARLFTFGRAGPQAYPISNEEEEEEVRAGEGCRGGTGGVYGLE